MGILRDLGKLAAVGAVSYAQAQAGMTEIHGQIDTGLQKGAIELGVEVRADRFEVMLQNMDFEDLLRVVRDQIAARDDVVIVSVDHRPGTGYAWFRVRRTYY